MERNRSVDLDLCYVYRAAEPVCHCGAFVTLPDSEQMVYSFPDTDLDDCIDILQCVEICKWEVITRFYT